MAMFGLPGGAEWLVILLTILLVFGPAVVVFLGGYGLGRAKGREEAAAKGPAAPDADADAGDDDE